MELSLPPEERDRLLVRLRRLEGQVRGVQRMIEQGRDCADVIRQLAAIKAGAQRVAMQLVAANMEVCVRQSEGAERERRLRQLARILGQL